ncbi:MAG: hypothetical protein ACSLFJ_06680, partial [Immundisolibacter sp.]
TLYNHHLPQKALDHVSPIQAMKRWQRSHPKLFLKRVVNRPGCDTLPAKLLELAGRALAIFSLRTRAQPLLWLR